ncbi:MAG: N-6 DNA methylase, partial [Alphaproteobacteria bacterium]|nr:N-6 DNA methylase [Alphaproteobacteria bacterium]
MNLFSPTYQETIANVYTLAPEEKEAMRAWQIFILEELARLKADQPTETDLHEQFFTDVFVDALGYQKRKAGEYQWTLASEKHTGVDKTRPDGVLGLFESESKTPSVHVVIELKGLGIDLDRRQTRINDKRTPVDQAFSYAHKFDNVQWVIVSNYKELRLYHSKSSKYALHFDLAKITQPDQAQQLQLLFALLHADRMLPLDGKPSHADQLFARREAELKSITDEFYRTYKAIREETWHAIRDQHPDANDSIRLAQKIIDRLLFVAFLEDKGFIHSGTIKGAMQFNPYLPQPIWDNFKGLFNGLDKGSIPLDLPAYNGGLFRTDAELDNLRLPDELMRRYQKLAEYDFASDLSVNILGHVFEQSITDLALLHAEAKGTEADTRRHDEGAFYTPDFVTEYLVDAVLTPYLANIRDELGETRLPELTEAEIAKGDRSKITPQHIEFWGAYLARFKALRILDPSCGSGAFLVATFDYLVAEGERINKELRQLNAPMLFTNFQSDILKDSLYGVDISAEAVEITSLSLWLKIANNRDPLVSLDKNIRVGNAVVDDPAIDPENAFNWHKEFPSIMEAGGFDIVIGNPPYVRYQLITALKP